MMIACPYCHQDYVWEVSISDLSGPFFMCFECDTVWPASGGISDQKGQNYSDFMAQRGRTPDWNTITKIRPANKGS